MPRERLELEANKSYWDAKRRPKVDKLVLLPDAGADHAAGRAAQRAGGLDRGAAAGLDPAAQGRRASRSRLNSYPHNWTHTLRLDKEPWNNKLVRKAANYAIDRVGICKNLLERHVHPGHRASSYKGHPWFGKPEGDLRVQPGQGQGRCSSRRASTTNKQPAKAVQLISTSGSGQMLPLAMNELIQKNLKDVGIDVDLQPVEWNTLLTRWRAGFKTPENEGLNAWNISWNFLEPWSGVRPVLPLEVGGAGLGQHDAVHQPGGGQAHRRGGADLRRGEAERDPRAGCTRSSSTTPRGSSWCTTRTRARCRRR